MLYTYTICPTCESLLPPEKEVCPVCGNLVEKAFKPHLFQIIPHVVCSNCGFPNADFDSLCPAYEALIDYHKKPKIVNIPVELDDF